MAKYKITGIPQSLPQAQNGKIVMVKTKNKDKRDKSLDNNFNSISNTPSVEVQNVEQPSYWSDMQSPVAKGEVCPPGKSPYNGECLTDEEYIIASNKEMEEWQRGVDEKKAASDQRFQDTREHLGL
jgi:hypothetical protein